MLFVLFSLSFVLFPSLFLSLFPSVSLTVSWSNSPALLCIWISVGLWQTQHTCQSCNTNTQTHTHTWLYSSQSRSLSLSLQSDWLSDQREALMLCYGDAVSGCPFQLVTYTWRERGKGNWGEYGDCERGKHTQPFQDMWYELTLYVCVCFRSCLSSRDPYCIWLSAGNCATVAPGFKWVKATSHDPSISLATVNTFTVH